MITGLLGLDIKNHSRIRTNWGLTILLLIAYSGSLIFLTFPKNLAIIFGLPLLVIIWFDKNTGIIIWFILSVLFNRFEIDLPGIPPLRPVHMILLMILGVWIIQYYREIPTAAAQFIRTRKNRFLLFLLGWITLSILMGRITGTTQFSLEYQFNAWLSVVLAISLSWLISNCFNKKLLKIVIWVNVILGIALLASVLVSGLIIKIGILDWKTHYYDFVKRNELIIIYPLFFSIIFLSEQKRWGKIIFILAIFLSVILNVLVVLGGSRSHLLNLLTLGFLILISNLRRLFPFVLIVVSLAIVFSIGRIKPIIEKETEYVIASSGLVSGKGDRIALAQDAIRIIRKYPFWGTGADYYQLYSNLYFFNEGTKSLYGVNSAHNTWLQIAVDNGIPAAAILAFFIAFVLKDAFKLYSSLQDKVFKKFVLLFLAGFCSIIITSPFGATIWPVFTERQYFEASLLAPYLISFWLSYGIILGIEKLSLSHEGLR